MKLSFRQFVRGKKLLGCGVNSNLLEVSNRRYLSLELEETCVAWKGYSG